ncbi:Protein ccc1 [Vanrija albida]|uniref:Protein ccc1 n=1 Tax=Vanrija albida TaxID=181172 RepID=A0ABR3PZE9_9TREE
MNQKTLAITTAGTTPAAAVPLRPRAPAPAVGVVWHTAPATSDPTQRAELAKGKCDADAATREVCCREFVADDKRHLVNPAVVRDLCVAPDAAADSRIIGLSDGLTVPFALTAGLSGLGSPKLVVTAGLAELMAGAISMGLGGFLASKAELDHYRYLAAQTHANAARACDSELERKVSAILGPVGVGARATRAVYAELRASEGAEEGGELPPAGRTRLLGVFRRPADARRTGLTAFLLKFGEGLEPVPLSRLWVSAATIGLAYCIGGLIPLIPYFFVHSATRGLLYSAVVAGAVLFVFGGFKTYFTGARGGVWGYAWGCVSTLLVGGLAAGAAFGLVKVLEVHG